MEPHFRGDDLGWTSGELRFSGAGTPVFVERYLASEDDVRDDLNAHAAELETYTHSPNHGRLMQHAIQTKQLITLRKPIDAANEVMLEQVLEESCRFFAVATNGVYQVDGRGWFSASGELCSSGYWLLLGRLREGPVYSAACRQLSAAEAGVGSSGMV